jgi:DNA primase
MVSLMWSLHPLVLRLSSTLDGATSHFWVLNIRREMLHVTFLVEGLFDLAVLWQAGFRNTTCAFGTHLTAQQFQQLSDQPGRRVYLAFDQDENQAGQRASQALAGRLQQAGLAVSRLQLPARQDPNSYFVRGARPADFLAYLQGAQPL